MAQEAMQRRQVCAPPFGRWAAIILSAPDTGAYAGMVIMGLNDSDRNAFDGSLIDIEGVVYMPLAKLIWVNYPNNPTAAVATDKFYQNLIDWAHKYDVAVISDNPYSEVCFEDYRAPSFLQFDGAKEVGIEFNSLSSCCTI